MQGTGSLTATAVYAGERAILSGSSSLAAYEGGTCVVLSGSGRLQTVANWSPRPVTIGEPIVDGIVPHEHDWYSFDADLGSTYDIITRSPGDNTDTELYLFDTDGTTQLDFCDDWFNVSSRIIWKCPASGTYFVMVRGYDDTTDPGPYTLTIRRMPDQEGITGGSVLYGLGTFIPKVSGLGYLPALASLGRAPGAMGAQAVGYLAPLYANGEGGFYIPPMPVFAYGNLQPITALGNGITTNVLTGRADLQPLTSFGADHAGGMSVGQELPALWGSGIAEIPTTTLVAIPALRSEGELEQHAGLQVNHMHGNGQLNPLASLGGNHAFGVTRVQQLNSFWSRGEYGYIHDLLTNHIRSSGQSLMALESIAADYNSAVTSNQNLFLFCTGSISTIDTLLGAWGVGSSSIFGLQALGGDYLYGLALADLPCLWSLAEDRFTHEGLVNHGYASEVMPRLESLGANFLYAFSSNQELEPLTASGHGYSAIPVTPPFEYGLSFLVPAFSVAMTGAEIGNILSVHSHHFACEIYVGANMDFPVHPFAVSMAAVVPDVGWLTITSPVFGCSLLSGATLSCQWPAPACAMDATVPLDNYQPVILPPFMVEMAGSVPASGLISGLVLGNVTVELQGTVGTKGDLLAIAHKFKVELEGTVHVGGVITISIGEPGVMMEGYMITPNDLTIELPKILASLAATSHKGYGPVVHSRNSVN